MRFLHTPRSLWLHLVVIPVAALILLLVTSCVPPPDKDPLPPPPPVDLITACFRNSTQRVETYWQIHASGTYRLHTYRPVGYQAPVGLKGGQIWVTFTQYGWNGVDYLQTDGETWVQVGYQPIGTGKFCAEK